MIGQKELVYTLAKFDDEIFMKEGFRKEHIDKAIEKYGLDKEEMQPQEEESLNDFAQRGAIPAVRSTVAEGSKPTGKSINLD